MKIKLIRKNPFTRTEHLVNIGLLGVFIGAALYLVGWSVIVTKNYGGGVIMLVVVIFLVLQLRKTWRYTELIESTEDVESYEIIEK